MPVQELRRETAHQRAGAASVAPAIKPRRLAWPLRSDRLLAILCLSPSLAAVAVFIYGFMLWNGFIAVVNWNQPTVDYAFVGLRNFERLFSTERFLLDVRNTAIFGSLFIGQSMIVGFVLAVLLDQRVRGEAIFRTIYVLPFAISLIVTGVAWKWLMYPASGINLLLAWSGLGFLQFKWFADPAIGIAAVTIAGAWQMSGYVMALYLAGLRGIPAELREAAMIDGANGFAYYRHVALPQLAPVTLSALVILGTLSLRVFDLTFSMTGSGPAFATDTPALFMYQTAFHQHRYSLGAAVGTLVLIPSICLILPFLLSLRSEAKR